MYDTDDNRGWFDNANVGARFSDIPFHLGEDGFRSWMQARRGGKDLHFRVAVGAPDRLNRHDRLAAQGLLPLTVVHRAAYVEPS
jgi:hypothetical protein